MNLKQNSSDHSLLPSCLYKTVFGIVFRALMTSREKLPAERKSELEQKLKEFYGVEELDDELLEETTKMDTK